MTASALDTAALDPLQFDGERRPAGVSNAA